MIFEIGLASGKYTQSYRDASSFLFSPLLLVGDEARGHWLPAIVMLAVSFGAFSLWIIFINDQIVYRKCDSRKRFHHHIVISYLLDIVISYLLDFLIYVYIWIVTSTMGH